MSKGKAKLNKNISEIKNSGNENITAEIKEKEATLKETTGISPDAEPATASEPTINSDPVIEIKTEINTEADIDTDTDINKATDTTFAKKKKGRFELYNLVRILFLAGFIVFTALFINEVIIQPYRIKKSIDYTRQLYNRPTEEPVMTPSPTLAPADETMAVPSSQAQALTPSPATDALPTPVLTPVVEVTPTPDPNKDEQGRLLDFKDLLAVNEDVKGWLTIPGTSIDYVVMQSAENDPDFYLDKDINKEYSKAGTLYLYYRASIKDSKNYVIFGHNMISTVEKMLRPILDYKKSLSYYKKHSVITFNTIYDNAKWKVFAVFITTPDADKEYFFDYRKSDFTDASDFLNFVYQIRIRSLINNDTVTVNENDQLLMLSTCSYEVNHNYRTVLVARKVRDGEDLNVDVDSVAFNDNPLYAPDYYEVNGGKAPKLYATFEEALTNGVIHWYDPPKEADGVK